MVAAWERYRGLRVPEIHMLCEKVGMPTEGITKAALLSKLAELELVPAPRVFSSAAPARVGGDRIHASSAVIIDDVTETPAADASHAKDVEIVSASPSTAVAGAAAVIELSQDARRPSSELAPIQMKYRDFITTFHAHIPSPGASGNSDVPSCVQADGSAAGKSGAVPAEGPGPAVNRQRLKEKLMAKQQKLAEEVERLKKQHRLSKERQQGIGTNMGSTDAGSSLATAPPSSPGTEFIIAEVESDADDDVDGEGDFDMTSLQNPWSAHAPLPPADAVPGGPRIARRKRPAPVAPPPPEFVPEGSREDGEATLRRGWEAAITAAVEVRRLETRKRSLEELSKGLRMEMTKLSEEKRRAADVLIACQEEEAKALESLRCVGFV